MSYKYYNNFSLIFPLTIVAGFALCALLSITLPLCYCKKTLCSILKIISSALHGFWLDLREENYQKVNMDTSIIERIAVKVLNLPNSKTSEEKSKTLKNTISDDLHELREDIIVGSQDKRAHIREDRDGGDKEDRERER